MNSHITYQVNIGEFPNVAGNPNCKVNIDVIVAVCSSHLKTRAEGKGKVGGERKERNYAIM